MTYLDKLRESAKKTAKPTQTNGHTPLQQQIRDLIAPLSPMQLNRPFTTEELRQQLEGKHRTRPASRDVAGALRQLGWTQKRCWKKSGLNRRFWYPPTPSENER